MLFEKMLQIGVAVVGGGAKRVAKLGIGIGDENRKKILAVETDEQRPVIGDELGEEREDEQRQEQPKRNVAAPIGLEIAPTPSVERREFEPVRRRGDAHRACGLGIRAQLFAAKRALGDFYFFFRVELDVHLTPPASRNRCADRSRYR